jgi:beta-lactamase class A
VPLEEINKSGLGEAVNHTLVNETGIYAVVIKNLTTGESFYYNENRPFSTASLYKLWVMAETYRQIEAGILREDELITKSIVDLNAEFYLDSNTAERNDGIISLSVSDAVKEMIVISDNYAGLLLTDKIRLQNLRTFLQKNNFLNSYVSSDHSLPTTTAFDMANFLVKLYLGDLADKENSEKMLNLLKTQRLNDKIPKYLPNGIPIAHKTGELDEFNHDVGIIFSPSSTYVVALLSETKDPKNTKEILSLLSKSVYEYFNPDSSHD